MNSTNHSPEPIAGQNKRDRFDIQQFVADFFTGINAEVEVPSYALMEVLVPHDFAPHFENQLLTLAFDPEVAEEEEATLVTPGSPILDTITGLILAEQKVLKREIVVKNLNLPAKTMEKIGDQLNFIKCRPPELIDSIPEEHHFLDFVFRIVLISDEKEEHLQDLVIDLHHAKRDRKLEKALPECFFRESPGERRLPLPDLINHIQALDLAKREVEKEALQQKNRFEKRLLPFKTEELQKVRSFYEHTERELKKRLETIDPTTERGETRTKNIKQKLEANTRDRKRRLSDIEDKYSTQIEISLDSLIHYTMPKRRVTLSLQQRTEVHTLDLFFNPLFRRFEPPLCSECGYKMREISFRAGKPVCPGCRS